jgi:3D (Asp-Asp-Asp) domain-containing protein
MHIEKYAKYIVPFAIFLVILSLGYSVFKYFNTDKEISWTSSGGSPSWWTNQYKKNKQSKKKPAKKKDTKKKAPKKTGGQAKAPSAKAANIGSSGGGKSFNCKLTFYTDDPAENHGYSTTADGSPLKASSRIIAVNKGRWNELKGKKIDIKGHGTYTVRDTCAGCASNHIDVLVGSKAEAMKNGVKNTTCTVL